MPTDTEMLDWLQRQLEKKKCSGRCIFRWSSTGRGFRLHEVPDNANWGKTHENIREAIAEVMNSPSGD